MVLRLLSPAGCLAATWVALVLVTPALASGHAPRASRAWAKCIDATVERLWRNPTRFVGRRVCVSGFLGRMIPYGEAAPELYPTKEDAEVAFSEKKIVLGFPFNVRVQERLSPYSARRLHVNGVFMLESACVPAADPFRTGTACDPPPEMRIGDARLRFLDGTQFR
jgi:hypothetical protein